jgi:dihydrofolate synthase/folylpolyglutamate synthase
MMAMLKFAEEKVDFAILECYMGGRLSSTNIIDRAEATAITSIAYDHMDILGSTLEAIAYEKAGIIS